jgi:hexosaminidase
MIKRKQNFSIAALLIFTMLLIQGTLLAKTPSDLSKADIIPKPVSITPTGGYFSLDSGAGIFIRGESAELKQIGQYLADKLNLSTGFDIKVKTSEKTPGSGNIYLTINDNNSRAKLGDEGYELIITKSLVLLSANNPAGLFRGIQSIRQVLPAKIELASKQPGPWEIATGTITDYPAYSYRGTMLDVARHFFGVEDVEKLIDYLAYYKMNALHLHLSDDQGWRIEIKSWPELTKHGGSTQVGGGKGGYYSQEQYSSIVRYAKDRYITIVPEIDMPGHINAALSSYAELNCNGKATDPYTGIEVGFSTLCTTLDITYKFINDVVGELAAITPGPYIHIGGDESHSTKREDYIPFINRVQKIVLAHGKKVLGWDDIAISSLEPNAVAQHWSNKKNAEMAVAQGAKILMSPAKRAYLDMQYDKSTKLGLHWAGYVEADSSYIWDPATLIPGVAQNNILGIEAALWTETITNMDEMEYMLFPRLPGCAEIGWTPSSERSWNEYKVRLGHQAERFNAMGISYFPSNLVPWTGGMTDKK